MASITYNNLPSSEIPLTAFEKGLDNYVVSVQIGLIAIFEHPEPRIGRFPIIAELSKIRQNKLRVVRQTTTVLELELL